MLLFYFLFLIGLYYSYSQETCETQIFLSTTNFLECQEKVESNLTPKTICSCYRKYLYELNYYSTRLCSHFPMFEEKYKTLLETCTAVCDECEPTNNYTTIYIIIGLIIGVVVCCAFFFIIGKSFTTCPGFSGSNSGPSYSSAPRVSYSYSSNVPSGSRTTQVIYQTSHNGGDELREMENAYEREREYEKEREREKQREYEKEMEREKQREYERARERERECERERDYEREREREQRDKEQREKDNSISSSSWYTPTHVEPTYAQPNWGQPNSGPDGNPY